MIYKFKCKATGDLLMAGAVGDRMLGIVGKPVAGQGILQPGDMLAAIGALELAVSEDQSRLSDVKCKPAVDEDPEEAADAVTLS